MAFGRTRYSKQNGLTSGATITSEYNTPSLNNTWVKVVGKFAYDKDGRVYNWQSLSLFPPTAPGWVLVCNKPLPTTVSGQPKKRVSVKH